MDNIRYITQDDIPHLITPCYITSTGEVWQYSNKTKSMRKRKVRYDEKFKIAKTTLCLDKSAKHCSTSINLATTVYRYFSDDDNIAGKIYINYKDGDPCNCSIDNLYRTSEYVREPQLGRTINRKDILYGEYGVQCYEKRLLLSDYSSVMCFLQLKAKYEKTPNIANTKLCIDIANWSENEVKNLEKLPKNAFSIKK